MPVSEEFRLRIQEDYLRRYEDQTLKAMENHSTAFGQALVAAYLLYPAELLLKDACNPSRFQIPLMLALYAYMTYNMRVLRSLVKDVHQTPGRIRELHNRAQIHFDTPLRLIYPESNRIRLASPLGPLQWASLRIAGKVSKSAHRATFWPWVMLSLFVLLCCLVLLLYPLGGLLWELRGLASLSVVAVVFPAVVAVKLFFRFVRPLIEEIKDKREKRPERLPWSEEKFTGLFVGMSDRIESGDAEEAAKWDDSKRGSLG
ncbi:MAG: hypothetical protein JNK48_07290 [Bryobacterales bacterium]|nr:hypothetical protein [Bryobacterales bacterium]